MNAGKDLFERAVRLHGSGRAKEAESLYRQVISRNAGNHRALYSFGVLLFETGRLEEANRYFERAVSVEHDPRYLTNLGETYRLLGRLDVAAESFGRILQLAPDFPDARLNLAVTLCEAGIYPDSLLLLQQALQRGPDGPRLRVMLAWVLRKLGRPKEAVVQAERAVELAPTSAAAQRALGDALDSAGAKERALGAYSRAVELNPADAGAHSELIIAMLSSPKHDDRDLFVETRKWAERHADPLKEHVRPLANDREPERRLRIGYVSPDLRAHALQQFLIPLLEQHDASAYEVFLYSSVERPDDQTEWYRSFAGDRFRDIRRLDDLRAAEVVREDRIDILVDLSLHMTGGRLRVFACRPAPVQITWLGYPGTTGLDSIDYRLTDPFLDPPGTDLSVYSEASLHLPETFWCYSAHAVEPAVNALPARTAGFVTFGCLNNPRKLHPGAYTLWARVLREVPDSRLLMAAEEHEREWLRAFFESEGVSSTRLAFGERTSRGAYLERYHRIDLGLDSFPYGGHTTTLDAAWMGVPVVTLTGPRIVQRAGVCIAENLGLPELVATSDDDFVAKAAGLARHLDRLGELRAGLRARLESSPLGDAPRFARNIEHLYRTAWRRYCATPRDPDAPA